MKANTGILEDWGWRGFFASQAQGLQPEQIGRVLKEERDHCVLINGQGQLVGGLLSGNMRKRRDDFENPGVGDWVVLKERAHDRDGLPFYRIESRLERFSRILRKAAGLSEKSQLLASNVDVAFFRYTCYTDIRSHLPSSSSTINRFPRNPHWRGRKQFPPPTPSRRVR
jgi:hypothetical protein